MRPRKGCQRCRERHAKCIINDQGRACERCTKFGEECDFLPHYRFRSDVPRTELPVAEDDTQPAIEWSEEQVWVPIKQQFKYVYENGQDVSPGFDFDEESTVLQDPATMSTQVMPSDHVSPSQLSAGPSPVASFHLPFDKPTPPGNMGLLNQQDLLTLANMAAMRSPVFQMSTPSPGLSSLPSVGEIERSITSPYDSLQTSDAVVRIQKQARSYSQSSETSVSPLGVISGLSFNRREVHLLHYFSSRFAPIADVCDPGSHFANEVPRRALYKPMLLLAVCAVSSRFEAITSGLPERESEKYHDRCLPYVIEALSASEATYDEDLLVTVLLLRIYEEFSSVEDGMHHLLGASQMLNHISKFAISGGMGEAASWQALRQIIYASIVKREPLNVDLENYDQSFARHSADDGSYANAMILLCAKVLKLVYGSLTMSTTSEKRALESKIDEWLVRRPRTFYPLTYQRADPDRGRAFPEITMLNSSGVIGVQYYYLTKILLLLESDQSDKPGPGFVNARQRMLKERQVLSHLLAVMGLALSNDRVHNAKYNASHMLITCGYLMSHRVQREESLRFLRRVPEVIAWRTKATIEMLEEQWRELDS